MAELGRNAQKNRRTAERKKELRESQIRARREAEEKHLLETCLEEQTNELEVLNSMYGAELTITKGRELLGDASASEPPAAPSASGGPAAGAGTEPTLCEFRLSLSPAPRTRERLGTIVSATGEPELDSEPDCLAAVVLHVALPPRYPARSLPRSAEEQEAENESAK